MDGFARRKEHSKEEIRKAAWELFSQFGVDKVSMMDIANKAGVSQATIYNNFESKETLVREFVDNAVEMLEQGVRQTLESAGQSYQEKMSAFFQFISMMMAGGAPSPAGNAVFGGSLDLQNDPEIKKIRKKSEEKMMPLLLGLIEEGRQQGQVNPELSDEALQIFFTTFMDIFPSAEFRSQYARRPSLVEELGLLMMNGLRGKQR